MLYLDTVSMWVVETVSIFAALVVVQTIVAVWVELVSCDTIGGNTQLDFE
jgi:hypothetical protein